LVVENYKNLPNKENSERKSKINQDSIHAENYFNEEKTQKILVQSKAITKRFQSKKVILIKTRSANQKEFII